VETIDDPRERKILSCLLCFGCLFFVFEETAEEFLGSRPGDIVNPSCHRNPRSLHRDRPQAQVQGVVQGRPARPRQTISGPAFDAILLEDRGKRAAKQTKHLVRVRIQPDNPEESIEFEVSEDRILLDAA